MYIILVLVSCRTRNIETEKSLYNRDLVHIKSLWESGEREQFPDVIHELASSSEEPEILWNYGSQVYAQRGRKELSRVDLEEARRFGFRCLSSDKSFSSLVDSNGGEINRQAIESLDESNPLLLNCAQWTTISWALWLHERGPQGAAYDIDIVRDMASWIHRYNPSEWTDYAIGITEALLPVYQFPNWNRAKIHFEKSKGLDELADFEYHFYLVRHTDKEAYCEYSIPEGIAAPYQERFADSKYYCDVTEQTD